MTTMICTASGQYVDVLRPEQHRFDIEDIAHALSHICRFCGHVREFYSVAQHSVLVSGMLGPSAALAGLLHDASEAYLGDVTLPLKGALPEYLKIEQRMQAAIMRQFGALPGCEAEVKYADLALLATERRDLVRDQNIVWPALTGVEPLKVRIVPLAAAEARRLFLDVFARLRSGEGGGL